MKVYRYVCAINQFIQDLPSGCVTLENLSQVLGKTLEPKKGAWYYYKEIQDFAEKNPDKCNLASGINGYKDIDDHSLWPKDISDAERKLYENQIKKKLKETAEIVSKQAGTLPMELSDILKKIKDKPPVFNWKKYFRRIVGNSISNELQLTKQRPSKRIPDSRGVRLKRKPNICVIVDTSGSINLNNFNDFFSEVNHIYKTGVNITVVECDTSITNIFKYSKNTEIEFKGRGGTDMTEGLKYYNSHKEFSSCVLFTDGYLCTFNLPFCKNLIWVITKDGNKSQKYPGQTIFIP